MSRKLSAKWVVAKVFLSFSVFKPHFKINHWTLKRVSLVYSVLHSLDFTRVENRVSLWYKIGLHGCSWYLSWAPWKQYIAFKLWDKQILQLKEGITSYTILGKCKVVNRLVGNWLEQCNFSFNFEKYKINILAEKSNPILGL